MSTINNTVISTLANVMEFMSPFAGGAVPDETDQEYADWKRWIQVKQEEAAKRGFWRRLLTRAEFSVSAGDETTLLPDNFHKSNGLYVFETPDGVDWADPDRIEDTDQNLFVEYVTDNTDDDFAKWRVRYAIPPEEDMDVIIWYFANPPMPVDTTDKVLLPGDMIGYGALSEYFRGTGAEGSQDDARNEFENRMNTYLELEMIPARYELLSFASRGAVRVDRIEKAKDYYRSRPGRNTQG